MPVEKSAGAVIFRKEAGKPLFLLLHYPSISHRSSENYWDFPKGHVEKGETIKDTVKREVKEETGLKEVEFIEGFKETIRYFFRFDGKTILKFVTFFLVETKEKEIKISGEHMGFKILPFEEAMEQLNYKNAKEILKKANNHLTQNKAKQASLLK